MFIAPQSPAEVRLTTMYMLTYLIIKNNHHFYLTNISACTMAEDLSGVYTDCTKYLRCIYGTFYALSCPSGTNFDYIKKACDLPAYSTCAVAPTTTPRPCIDIYF